MKTFGLFACALACAVSSVAIAAPPQAPNISVHSTDIRQLEFTWDAIAGTQRYELWFSPVTGAAWSKYQEQDARRGPRFRISVGVHLLDWQQARYLVKACNLSGCSSSNQVGVNGEQLVAMGYFKPNNPVGHNWFGAGVALSADGTTMAVYTAENLGGRQISAVVHVYRKTTSLSGWRREARLLPSVVQAGTAHLYRGDAVALSGDGNLLVLGVSPESVHERLGPGGTGAVYLFRRSGTTWALAQRITTNPRSADYFGNKVKIDDAGRTLVVSHNFPTDVYAPGTLEIYRDPVDANDQFVHTASLPVPVENNEGMCDGAIALSGDGQTLLRGCRAPAYTQVLNGPGFSESAHLPGTADGLGITYDGRVFVAGIGLETFVYRLTASGWVQDADLTAASGIINASERSVAISRDGKIAALGNPWDSLAGIGPIFPPYASAPTQSGAVTVFERKTSGWTLRRWVKPGSTHDQWFGHAVALGNNGKILAVGAPFDPSAATGIDGDRDDASRPERGAVWLY
jgi:hypothetical protein